MENRADIKKKIEIIGMDAAIWVTDHIKEIGISIGIVSLAVISHRIGYNKAQREIADGCERAWSTVLETMIRGGDEWMK